VAGASRSGYYRWPRTADAPDGDYGDYLLIREAFDGGRGKLGSRSVQMGLSSGMKAAMNHKKVARIMRKYGLRAKTRKVNPYRAIMKRTLEHTTFPNVLDRQFPQDKPYGTFCTDITYLPSNGRTAYLSAIKDLASREIVGWNLSMRLEMDIVMETLADMEDRCRGRIASFDGTLIHSDQGFRYTNPLYSDRVRDLGMVQSMSRKGTCIDNAPMESFFGHNEGRHRLQGVPDVRRDEGAGGKLHGALQ